MAGRVKAATDANEPESNRLFNATVRKMLEMPPVKNEELKKGTPRKRSAPASGKGSKS